MLSTFYSHLLCSKTFHYEFCKCSSALPNCSVAATIHILNTYIFLPLEQLLFLKSMKCYHIFFSFSHKQCLSATGSAEVLVMKDSSFLKSCVTCQILNTGHLCSGRIFQLYLTGTPPPTLRRLESNARSHKGKITETFSRVHYKIKRKWKPGSCKYKEFSQY